MRLFLWYGIGCILLGMKGREMHEWYFNGIDLITLVFRWHWPSPNLPGEPSASLTENFGEDHCVLYVLISDGLFSSFVAKANDVVIACLLFY